MEIKNELLEDRMKRYELEFTKEVVDTSLPICVRLDGIGFSTFTENLVRPFDQRLSKIMIDVTNFLVEKTGASVGYTQSDEITLVFLQDPEKEDFSFNGKIQKLTSSYAAKTSVRFNKLLDKLIPEKHGEEPVFDARIWNVPTKEEALNVILWRMRDACKNSISMACHAYIPHKQTLAKNSLERLKMLQDIGISWSDYPEYFKTGTLSTRVVKKYDTVPEEFAKYHKGEDKSFFRTHVESFNLPELLTNYSEGYPKLMKKIMEYKDTSKELREAKKNKM